jgi:hypothetical protein
MQKPSTSILHWFRLALIHPASEYYLPAGVTIVAAVLRFYKIGIWSFWTDEIFSVGFKQDGFDYSEWRVD